MSASTSPTDPKANETLQQAGREFRPLRVWPAAIILIGMAVTKFVPLMIPEESSALLIVMVFGPLALGLLMIAWWLFYSRATGVERILVPIVFALATVLTSLLSDKSLFFDGSYFGPGLLLIMIPMGFSAFGIGAILCAKVLSIRRTAIALLLATLGFGFTGLLKSDGMWGNGVLDLSWRWTPSAEQEMLAERENRPKESLSSDIKDQLTQQLVEPEWPRFRGADGQSRFAGPRINTDWKNSPPNEKWRIDVGPGWASFAVLGSLIFTQEQLGDQEAITCYSTDSGQEIWTQSLETRFSDPLGGPGPRATPTLAAGKLFALGAKGQLQCLDPFSGDVQWSKDIRQVANREPPVWGYSSSPLVVGSVVVVHAGGKDGKGTLAFDVSTGDLAWSASAGDHSYSSPEICRINGKDYVAMLTNSGLDLLDPATGNSQLKYDWKCAEYRALQPQVIDGNAVLIPTQESGTRLVRIESSENGLTAEEVWTSRFLKPDFNDFVIFQNHAYGFDGGIFTCIDLKDGNRKWKRGRYGKGQVLLLEKSNALLVMTEKGELVLLEANPSSHKELTKLQVLNDRTWNHPVIVGSQLYVRNSEEAACYSLPFTEERK